jgi:hypothetical protein
LTADDRREIGELWAENSVTSYQSDQNLCVMLKHEDANMTELRLSF